jgi:hypothetical protein
MALFNLNKFVNLMFDILKEKSKQCKNKQKDFDSFVCRRG